VVRRTYGFFFIETSVFFFLLTTSVHNPDSSSSFVTLGSLSSTSVSLQMIADLIPIRRSKECLVIGCGNSNLPRFIHDQRPNISITCLDSSQTCLDQLKQLHARDCPRMSFLCGDAVNLSDTLLAHHESSCGCHYDSIVDKGLVDALMCGEGWNGPVAQLFDNVGKVLMPNKGSYVLVCYKLSPSTREFLQQVGNEALLSWTFDLPGSNDRVSISIARKVQRTGLGMG
jgi:SAM-dependent methyltransferase